MFVFTQVVWLRACKATHPPKGSLQFRLCGDHIGLWAVFKPSEKILKIGIAVWIFCGSCLDTYHSGYEISKYLDYWKCLKKLVQNSEYLVI